MIDESDLPPRLQWQAYIVNWAQIFGFGKTRNEALQKLEASFQIYKNEHEYLPRPGTKVPLEFASTSKVDKYEPVARDFLHRILNHNYDETFISDASSLQDFFFLCPEYELKEKIFQLYGIHVSSDDKLWEIFQQIERLKY